MNKKTFWSDEAHIHFHKNKGKISGGYYFRAFELVKLFKRLKADGKEVVALEFDDSNNVKKIHQKLTQIRKYRGIF